MSRNSTDPRSSAHLLATSFLFFFLISTALLILPSSPVWAQPSAPAPDWSAWQPLLGEWVGEGGGGPGEGTGGFTYAADLQGRVLVRRNFANYPAGNGRPAFSHDDLMVIYQEPPGTARADYFDNEGHVIRYGASWSADGRTLALVSDPAPGAPRFRLTQALAGQDSMRIRFEIASPAMPDSFRTYIEARAHRKR